MRKKDIENWLKEIAEGKRKDFDKSQPIFTFYDILSIVLENEEENKKLREFLKKEVLPQMRGSSFAIKKYSGYNPIALEETIKKLEEFLK